MQAKDLSDFLAAYMAAALWSSSDTGPDGVDYESLESFDIAPEAREKAAADCAAWCADNLAMLTAAADCAGYSWGHAGHDFWLTRNHHGAGFWDGDLPDAIGDALTEAAEAAGEVWPYIGDDWRIYF